MQHCKMTLEDALITVRQNRPAAKPNDGFMVKLRELQKTIISE